MIRIGNAHPLSSFSRMNVVRWSASLVGMFALTLGASAQTGLPILSQPIPNQIVNRGRVQIDLKNHFGVPGVSGQVVQFATNFGRVNVELRTTDAPRNVANFLSYVTKNAYDNTLLHRVDNLGTSVPAIVHGGAYVSAPIPPVPATIPRSAPVPVENRLQNSRGTLSAFHTVGDPNGATSEWFFNVLDNTNTLGPNNDGGFTAFGRVLGTGMSVIDEISRLQTVSLGAPLTQLPVRNVTATQTQLTPANLAVVNTVRVVPIYPPAVGDPSAVLSFAATQSTQGAGTVAASIAGSVLTLEPLAVGTVTLQIRARDSNGNESLATTFTVTVPPGSLLPPVFTAQPSSQTVGIGTTVVLNAFATGGESGVFPLRYHWLWSPASGGDTQPRAIPVPESPFLVLRKVTPADAGRYICVASNALGETRSVEAVLTVVPAEPFETGRLINLAIRTHAGILDETLIVGFGVGGTGTSGNKPLLVRGVGPTLSQFGLSNVLADPVLTLFQSATTVATNDNWNGDTQVIARSRQVGAFTLASNQSLDSALALSSSPGAYTVQIKGNEDGTGTALAEIYDATANESFNDTTPRLVNASARAQVDPSNLLIAGFVVGGTQPVTVLIRAIGATLGAFGVEGALENPQLQLYSGTALVRENDDWGGDPQLTAAAASVGAFVLGDPASKDSVILVTLAPGSYTAQVRGAGESSGVALVEVYELR